MPTYQYACTECGHQLEAVQSFSDAALTECPNCEGKLRKVFNSVGIVLRQVVLFVVVFLVIGLDLVQHLQGRRHLLTASSLRPTPHAPLLTPGFAPRAWRRTC